MIPILVLIVLLQVKHLFADFYLQTPRMLSGRDIYMHMGRAQHASVHALGTMIVLLVSGTPIWPFILLVIGEWMIHFHIDYWKGSYSSKRKLTPDQAAFWRVTGFDQFLHQLTYVAMCWLWLEWCT